jgi:hypothetical protein
MCYFELSSVGLEAEAKAEGEAEAQFGNRGVWLRYVAEQSLVGSSLQRIIDAHTSQGTSGEADLVGVLM